MPPFARNRAARHAVTLFAALGAIVLSVSAPGLHAQQLSSALAATLSAHFARCVGAHRQTCVVDGDTIWLDGDKIRLADINAPETHRAGCDYEQKLGERATDRLVMLLNAGPFSVTRGTTATGTAACCAWSAATGTAWAPSSRPRGWPSTGTVTGATGAPDWSVRPPPRERLRAGITPDRLRPAGTGRAPRTGAAGLARERSPCR